MLYQDKKAINKENHLLLSAVVSSSWQVSSFSETKAHQILQQKPAQYLRFNQHQLSRIYPSSYRVDSSNYNPQPFWNAGCQLGEQKENLFGFGLFLEGYFKQELWNHPLKYS